MVSNANSRKSKRKLKPADLIDENRAAAVVSDDAIVTDDSSRQFEQLYSCSSSSEEEEEEDRYLDINKNSEHINMLLL